MVCAALVAGEVLRGLEQLPAHAPPLEFRQDVQGEFRQVEVLSERQGDVDGPDNLAVDLGHENYLALVGVRHLQEFLQRRVGEIVAAPGLHAHPAAHFDGGNEVGGVRPVQRIGDPQLLNPYVVCHKGHHPSCSAIYRVPDFLQEQGFHGQHMPVCAGVPSATCAGPLHSLDGGVDGPLPFAVVPGGPESERHVDGEHVVVFRGVERVDAFHRRVLGEQAAEVADFDEHAQAVPAVAGGDQGVVLVRQPRFAGRQFEHGVRRQFISVAVPCGGRPARCSRPASRCPQRAGRGRHPRPPRHS